MGRRGKKTLTPDQKRFNLAKQYVSKGIKTFARAVGMRVKDIQKAWNPGSLVMWRRRPEVKEENNKDPGWFERGEDAPDENAPDNWEVQVSIRIGSFDIPKVKTKIEGNPLQYINV